MEGNKLNVREMAEKLCAEGRELFAKNKY